MPRVIFHLSFAMRDLEEATSFYVDGLGCQVGRESRVAQLSKQPQPQQKRISPRHFGLVCQSQQD